MRGCQADARCSVWYDACRRASLKRRPGQSCGDDAFLGMAQCQGALEHLDGTGLRHHHDAVVVGHDPVTGGHAHVAEADHLAYGFHLDTVLARPHEPATGVQRIANLFGFSGVTADAVDHRAANAAVGGQLAEDAAPDRAVGAPRVVQHDDGALGRVVQVVTDRARALHVHRCIAHGEGRAEQALSARDMPHAQHAARQAQRIQRVGDFRRAEQRHIGRQAGRRCSAWCDGVHGALLDAVRPVLNPEIPLANAEF